MFYERTLKAFFYYCADAEVAVNLMQISDIVLYIDGALEASVNSQYIGVWHVTHSLIDSIL